MQDYPNMSYCMYENTTNALRQILDALDEAMGDNISLESYRKGLSSRQEAEAFDDIRELCGDIIYAIKSISDNEDDDEDEEL